MITVDIFNKLIKQKNIVIVYFYSIDLESINININNNESYKDNFLLIDILKENKLVKDLNIKSAPLFRIYKKGNLIEEIFGTYENINSILKSYL